MDDDWSLDDYPGLTIGVAVAMICGSAIRVLGLVTGPL
jgi:hypothetical protein